MDKVPLTINLDIEPDTRTALAGRPAWTGFEALFDYMARLRPELSRATGTPARFTWCLRLDPQIEKGYGAADWVVQHYRPLLDALQAQGDEIGVHAHAWRWDDAGGQWLADHGNERWVAHCTRSSLQVFRASFGRPARVFRHGDRFLSNRLIALLDREGVQCDLTLEPGHISVKTLRAKDRVTGMIPDYSTAPRRPYRPSRRNYQRPGWLWKRKLWIVPLTTGTPLPTPGQPPALDADDPCSTMVLGFPFPIVRQLFDLTLAESARPFVAAVARCDVLLDRYNADQFDQFFHYLLDHPLRDRLVLEPAPDALRRVA
jgi:hypothetical protein